MKPQPDKNINIHKDHRGRLKRRFRNYGLEGFEPHNVLELLLFYAIPQKDTNPLAHALIEHCGSLQGVFEADFDELTQVDGIGEHAALLLKLFPAIRKYLLAERAGSKKAPIYPEDAGTYMADLYRGVRVETVYMLLFDNARRLIDSVRLFEGSVNAASLNVRCIAETGIRGNASFFILAHNHPGGNPVPSQEDIVVTRRLRTAFAEIGMPMEEHLLVAGDVVTPILATYYYNCKSGGPV